MAADKRLLITPILAALWLAFASAPPPAGADDATPSSGFSGDPNKPRRHFRVRDAADLKAAEARALYQRIRDHLSAGYAASGRAVAKNYQNWTRFNTAPYRSVTHGRRYVNNYANEKASAYGAFENAGALPVGAVIAKDSFVVATDGEVTPGPLFVMEKLEKGFNYVSGDWRYTMIMPDGRVFGVTKGENAERVEFCIGCHLAREKFDHLFFVPDAYRTK